MRSILSLLCLAAAAAAAPAQRLEYEHLQMGTWARVVLWTDDAALGDRAAAAAFARIDALNAMFDDRSATSELNRLCDDATPGCPRPVSDDLWRVLDASRDLWERTGGAFDVTVGPVVRLWRAARTRGRAPDPGALRDALALVGSRHLLLDPARRSVALGLPGMRLDLGGIAKGYAAGQALRACVDLGLSRVMVAVGGDIVAGDPPPGEEGWRIGLPSPRRDADAPDECLLLARGAVSTSGDREQHTDVGPARHSHIVDPRDGIGVTHRCTITVAVSGTADDGLLADGLASALSVAGPGRAMEIVGRFPAAAARIVIPRPERDAEIATSSSFARWRVVPRAGATGAPAPR